KQVFWQALLATVRIFSIGLVLCVYLEQLRTDQTNIAFYQSETSLLDALVQSFLISSSELPCDELIAENTEFADRVYIEAIELEKFDDSSKLTESLKAVHKKYDLLRTILWNNVISLGKKCEINSVVYLYLYDTEDIGLRSEQIVWNRVLTDLKEERGNEILLIPIAVDQEIVSLQYLVSKHNIKRFPAVIVNEQNILYDPISLEEIEIYFKNSTVKKLKHQNSANFVVLKVAKAE
ncbi:MAG: hypothetical protein AABY22_27565, partial [Nanoarchaeota archaeon]